MTFLGIKSVLATGDIHTGDQSLQIPLPRPDGRLIKVVDVDHDIPLWSSIQTEVVDVRIAVDHDLWPADRRAGQVGCHDRTRASQECERRLDHAPYSQRDQTLLTPDIARQHRRHRVRPICWRLPGGVRFAGRLLSQRLALLVPSLPRIQRPHRIIRNGRLPELAQRLQIAERGGGLRRLLGEFGRGC